jgi:hypothetical protein
MDISELQKTLGTTKSQIEPYLSGNLPSMIEGSIQEAYTPLLQESLDTTKQKMSDYLGRFMETTSFGPGMQGTTAYDLSPTQKMGVIGRELGSMTGSLNASARYSDYLGAQMNDMYSKALQAAQMGQQNLADQYGRQYQNYQLAVQLAEAEKDRQLQRELAELQARSSGGGGYTIDLGPTEAPQQGPSQDQIIKSIADVANQIKAQRGKIQGPYSYGGFTGNIDQLHNQIMREAKDIYGINLNPEWLWGQLGNTTTGVMGGMGPVIRETLPSNFRR